MLSRLLTLFILFSAMTLSGCVDLILSGTITPEPGHELRIRLHDDNALLVTKPSLTYIKFDSGMFSDSIYLMVLGHQFVSLDVPEGYLMTDADGLALAENKDIFLKSQDINQSFDLSAKIREVTVRAESGEFVVPCKRFSACADFDDDGSFVMGISAACPGKMKIQGEKRDLERRILVDFLTPGTKDRIAQFKTVYSSRTKYKTNKVLEACQ